MIEPIAQKKGRGAREKALLVGLAVYPTTRRVAEEHLEELALLADTAGADVVDTYLQSLPRPDGTWYIGKGKAEEIAEAIEENDAITLVIIDDDLSPVQIRNLEEKFERKVVDRSGLILDIFASRARTSEARTQVELAQLLYLMPRLTRMWTHLSKQYGGIGTKGPGETQIETDRRIIKTRISHLRSKLAKIETQRETQRKGRDEMFRASLVGYTNAGKSTLMNELVGEKSVKAEDRLFATLDTTVRQVELENGQTMLLGDTVGFIRKLPSHLVASFRTTLAESRESDLLLHVVDVSSPTVFEQIAVVRDTLRDIGAEDVPVLMVFNKIDRLDAGQGPLLSLQDHYPESVAIAAATGLGVAALRDEIVARMEATFLERSVQVPLADWHHLARLQDLIEIVEKRFTDEHGLVRFRYSPKITDQVERALALSGAVAVDDELVAQAEVG